MTCKDCVHYNVCKALKSAVYCDIEDLAPAMCMTFKDKSRFIELPCEIGHKDVWVIRDL